MDRNNLSNNLAAKEKATAKGRVQKPGDILHGLRGEPLTGIARGGAVAKATERATGRVKEKEKEKGHPRTFHPVLLIQGRRVRLAQQMMKFQAAGRVRVRSQRSLRGFGSPVSKKGSHAVVEVDLLPTNFSTMSYEEGKQSGDQCPLKLEVLCMHGKAGIPTGNSQSD